MLKYKIKDLAQSTAVRRPGTRVLLPTITPSRGAELEYLAALRAMLKSLLAAVREDVLPVVEADLKRDRQAGVVTDAMFVTDIDSATFERIKQLGQSLGLIATNAVNRILGLESKKHTKTFMQTAKKALGVDLSAVVRDEDLENWLEVAATRNAALIKGLGDATVQRIQVSVTNAVLNGIPAADLKKQLVEDFGFADSRARLIARDQIGKTTADLTRIRHTQAGITKYIWRTSHDERVRPRHIKCDGVEYEYGKPTDAEQGLPPGQPIQCRCIGQAVVEF